MIDIRTYADDNQAYWNRRAPSYAVAVREAEERDGGAAWLALFEKEFSAAFPDRAISDLRVLDVGTGPGFLAVLLAKLGARVTAVDYTEGMLEEAARNAEGLDVRFHRMDAESLGFEDASFDVVVSRNVTWNLPRPLQAYREWTRVLRPNGLLLNFDANWYRYLYCKDAARAHREDKANVRRAGVKDDTDGTDIPAMESIARRAELSGRVRPAWDRAELEALGLEVETDEDAWRHLWNEDERLNNASTPLFMVRAVKPEAAAGDAIG